MLAQNESTSNVAYQKGMASSPRPQSELYSVADSLEGRISRCNDIVTNLFDRLSPVTSMAGESKGSDTRPSMAVMSPLGSRYACLAEMAGDLEERLTRLLDSLVL